MFKSLLVRNFQSHKRTLISLHPGVNVIRGLSDTGKSAMVRALNLVCFNKPSGTDYCSSWGGLTLVKLKTDSDVICRVRTKSKNYYRLNGAKLKAMGTDVPEPVEAALRVVDDVTFQRQFDAPFGLSMTAGELSRRINQIVDLTLIDTAMRNADGMKRSLTGKIADLITSRTQLKRSVEELKEQTEATTKAVYAFKKEATKHAERDQRLSRLQDLRARLSKLQEEQYEMDQVDVQHIADMRVALDSLRSLCGRKESLARIAWISKALAQLRSSVEEAESGAEKATSRYKKAVANGCPMCGHIRE